MKILKYSLILLFLFVLVLTVLFSGFSFFRLFFDVPSKFVNIFIMFFGCLGIFITMAFFSRIFKKNCVMMGLVFGLILSLLITLLTIFVRGNFLNLFDFLKITIIILSSVFGGLIGKV